MGNCQCQAAEVATVLIQHPGGKLERIYCSVSADEVMNSNPGHYVAMFVASPAAKTESGAAARQLKLLRPSDTLLIGHVYRLVSFEDVLKEFTATKLGKLLKERGKINVEPKTSRAGSGRNSNLETANGGSSMTDQHEVNRVGSGNGSRSVGRHRHVGGGQWKPALQSIAELGK